MVNDPKMDTLLDEGASMLDPKKRAQIYSEIQVKIMREALEVPLFDAEYVTGFAPRVRGLEIDRRTAIYFQNASVTG